MPFWVRLSTCLPVISPLGSSLTTSRPFRHTTFPVAASTNTRDGILVTLYLFHSFICTEKKKITEEKGRLGWRDLGVYVHFNFRGGKPFNPVKIYACLRLQRVHLKYDKKREKVRAVYIFHRANTLSVVSKRLWRHGGRIKNTGVQSAPEVN